MAKVIAIMNEKGGVGKTATATTLAYLLAKNGKKTKGRAAVSESGNFGQRADSRGGAIDTGIVTRTVDAKHRGYTGESGTHGNDNPYSGGNHTQRSGFQNQTDEKSENKPSVDRDKKLSTDGFFVLPKSKAELQKEQGKQKENSLQYQSVKLEEEEISEL